MVLNKPNKPKNPNKIPMHVAYKKGFWTSSIWSFRFSIFNQLLRSFYPWSYNIPVFSLELIIVLPVRISFLTFGKSFRSTMHWTTPCMVPNCESMPRVKSIRKKMIAQIFGKGNWFIASVNKMKARPVPLADWKFFINFKLLNL